MRPMLLLTLVLIAYSCQNPEPEVSYPYVEVNCKVISYETDANEHCVFAGPSEMNLDTLAMFCKSLKSKSKPDRWFYYYTFICEDSAGTAPPANFPPHELTDFEEWEKYYPFIKATYTYNTINGYSKLMLYDSNMWTGSSHKFDI